MYMRENASGDETTPAGYGGISKSRLYDAPSEPVQEPREESAAANADAWSGLLSNILEGGGGFLSSLLHPSKEGACCPAEEERGRGEDLAILGVAAFVFFSERGDRRFALMLLSLLLF